MIISRVRSLVPSKYKQCVTDSEDGLIDVVNVEDIHDDVTEIEIRE